MRYLLALSLFALVQSQGSADLEEAQRAAALEQEANKMYAQLQARWNAEAGVNSDPTQQTLHTLTSAQNPNGWGGVASNGPGLTATLQSLASSFGGTQQQPFMQNSNSFLQAPFTSGFPQLQSSPMQTSLQGQLGGNSQNFLSGSFGGSGGKNSGRGGQIQNSNAWITSPLMSTPSSSTLMSSTPMMAPFLPAQAPAQPIASSSFMMPLAAPLPLQAPALRPALGQTSLGPALQTSLGPAPLSLAAGAPPIMAPKISEAALPSLPSSTSPEDFSRAKADYLKRFPQVSPATQQFAIQDFILLFEKQDFKHAALHFASDSIYESNGITYPIDLSKPSSWVEIPPKTRTGCRFVPKSPSVMWGSCVVSYQGLDNPESMEVTFDPAGFITKFSKLEPKSCSAPQAVTSVASMSQFAAPVSNPRK